MRMQLHQESGLHIEDTQGEIIYKEHFARAAQDADLSSTPWPDESIIRIFHLPDGRIAVVRQTAAGLKQEAATPQEETLLATFTQKLAQMLQKRAVRLEALLLEDEFTPTDQFTEAL